MKRFSFRISIIFGVCALYKEFFGIKDWMWWFFDYVFLFVLALFGVVFFFKDLKLYNHSRKLISFLPSLTALFISTIIVAHAFFQFQTIKSKTVFTAYNYQLTDEGFHMEFKENGYIKAILVRHFSEDFYWGTYKKSGDTIRINMRTNVNLGNLAVLKNDTMRMVGDSIFFWIDRSR